MINRTTLLAGCIAVSAASASAETFFTVAEDILPAGLGTLQDARDVWAGDVDGPLVSEGFEGLTTEEGSYDFDDFSVAVGAGDFILFGSNALVRTEGEQGLGFSGSFVLTILLDSVVTDFGIDWSSFDRTDTTISYLDNGGGALADIFDPVTSAGAGFFGVKNTAGFSEITFTVASTEIIEFDNIQFGGAVAAVPIPASLPLLLGAVGAFGLMRRRATA